MKCKTTPGCAPYAKLCDGVLDCADASDENITVCDELKYHKETALLKSKCQAKDQVPIFFKREKASARASSDRFCPVLSCLSVSP